jgi:hypothetical protein
MILVGQRARTEETLLERASPFLQVIALIGIPAAGCLAFILLVQIPRSIDIWFAPFLLAAEIGCWITVLVLLFVLRACLALPSAPSGLYRNVLDFVAVAHWHLSVKAALVGLIVLPPVWILRANHHWLVTMLLMMGPRALKSGDFQSGLETVAVALQLSLTGGVPLLFILHMLSRRQQTSRVLLWLLVPLLFVGTVIAVVLLVTILHQPG